MIGALLGVRDTQEGVSEVVHSFPVTFQEDGDQVTIDTELFNVFLDFHTKIHSKRSVLLGWYSVQVHKKFWRDQNDSSQPLPCDPLFEANTLLINEFFAGQVKVLTTGSWSTAPPCICLHLELGEVKKGVTIAAFMNGHADEDGSYQLVPICHYVFSNDHTEAAFISALQHECDPKSTQFNFENLTAFNQKQNDEFKRKLNAILLCKKSKPEETSIDDTIRHFPELSIFNNVCENFKEEKRIVLSLLDKLIATSE